MTKSHIPMSARRCDREQEILEKSEIYGDYGDSGDSGENRRFRYFYYK